MILVCNRYNYARQEPQIVGKVIGLATKPKTAYLTKIVMSVRVKIITSI